MKTKRILIAVFLVLLIIGIAQPVYYYPKLPDPVASHFNAQGIADGHTSRLKFVLMTVGIEIGLATLMFGLAFGLRFIPDSAINLPHKDYWLAEERRDATFERLTNSMLWLGIATQTFLVGTHQIVVLENLGFTGMRWFWPLLLTFMFFIIGFSIAMLRQFSLPIQATQPVGFGEDDSDPSKNR